MLREFIKHNDASLIYECNVFQIEKLIKDENLTKDEIKYLKEKLDMHYNKMESFKYILGKLIL